MTIQDFRIQEMKNVKWDTEKPSNTGGQHCGMSKYPVIAIHEELQIKITIGCHRSRYQDKNLARILMELALDDYYNSIYN